MQSVVRETVVDEVEDYDEALLTSLNERNVCQ